MRNAPDSIDTIAADEIFVFGSNLSGHHGGGAAKTAFEKFGAVYGEGEGLYGNSYAFPTLGHGMERLTIERLTEAVERLYANCAAFPELTFLLTKVGCGIAGYPEEDMKRLFAESPANLIKPKGW